MRCAFEKDKAAQFIFQNMELRLHLEIWRLLTKWTFYSLEVENQMYYINFYWDRSNQIKALKSRVFSCWWQNGRRQQRYLKNGKNLAFGCWFEVGGSHTRRNVVRLTELKERPSANSQWGTVLDSSFQLQGTQFYHHPKSREQYINQGPTFSIQI